MKPGFTGDPHSERGDECPRNKLGITDYAALQPVEAVLLVKRLDELRRKKLTGRFDIPHLQSIHRYLFQDVFPWAGEFRAVNFSKGPSNFAPAMHVHGALEDALGKLKRESWLANLPVSLFAQRAAFYLGEINAIHPFREGNGRTQREFLRQLSEQAGHPLSWAGFTQQEMVDASILSHTRGDNTALAAILERAIEGAK